MKKISILLMLAINSLVCLHGQGLPGLLDNEATALLSAYKWLHAHPELSFEEKETSAFVARKLREYGYEVTEQVGNYGSDQLTSYGLVAVLRRGEGPTVMLRADMDGLPVEEKTGLEYASQVRTTDASGDTVGVMHACGHDLHMTSLLGSALLLSRLDGLWSGTLVLVGQPSEERGAGAKAMIADGLFERFPKPDYVIALHSDASLEAGKIGYVQGYALANVDSVDIKVRGRGGHGAYPHTTKDPVTLTAQIIVNLQAIVSRKISALDAAVISVGSVHGGTKHNIIPDEVDLQLTVRSYKPEVRRTLLSSIRSVATETARAAGFPEDLLPIVQISEDEYTRSTYNDPGLVSRLKDVFRATLGEQMVVEKEPVMAGEDFSLYGIRGETPAALFWLGAVDPVKMEAHRESGTDLPSLHSSQFAPMPEPAIRTGVRALTSAVLDLMTKP